MKKIKANTGYTRFRESELAIFAGKVADAVTDNPHFDPANPAIANFKALVEDYTTKLQIATRGGSKHDNDLKKESRDKLRLGLQLLAQYVNSVAQGNEAIISSAGLITNKPDEATAIPEKVVDVRLQDGDFSGHLKISFIPQKGVSEYHIQVGRTLAGSEAITWGEIHLARSSRGNFIANLEPGVRHYIRVRAHNVMGDGDWSEFASLIVR